MLTPSARRHFLGTSLHPVWAVAVGTLVASTLATAGDSSKRYAYGQHLSRECTACHRLDGADDGIPSIVGWPPDTFIATVRFYSDGGRNNPVMVSVANSLSDEQLEALALFFASLPKPEKRAAPPAHGNKRRP